MLRFGKNIRRTGVLSKGFYWRENLRSDCLLEAALSMSRNRRAADHFDLNAVVFLVSRLQCSPFLFKRFSIRVTSYSGLFSNFDFQHFQ